MSWLQKLLPPKIQRTGPGARKTVPEGLWTKCAACDAVLYSTDLEKNLNVCPKCGHHERLGARPRLDALLDADGRFEIGSEVLPVDPLKFKDSRRYAERLAEAQEETAEGDALVVMQGSIKALGVVCAAFEFDFMGGSMGSVVGERFVRGVRVAIEQKLPFVCVTASGGARMQEGALSLVQMAKTTAALTDLAERGLPFVSVLTDPTMGGVSASFAMIGDVVIAEPKALIGFAGPRVIEQTVRQKLPEGFQRAEFLLEKGAIDMIVDRRQLRDKLHSVLSLLQGLPAETVRRDPARRGRARLGRGRGDFQPAREDQADRRMPAGAGARRDRNRAALAERRAAPGQARARLFDPEGRDGQSRARAKPHGAGRRCRFPGPQDRQGQGLGHGAAERAQGAVLRRRRPRSRTSCCG